MPSLPEVELKRRTKMKCFQSIRIVLLHKEVRNLGITKIMIFTNILVHKVEDVEVQKSAVASNHSNSSPVIGNIL